MRNDHAPGPARTAHPGERTRSSRRRRFALAVLLLASVFPAMTLLGTPASALPAGFVEQTVLTGLTQPMAVRFSPDGRVFVAEKSGLIKVFDGLGDPTATVVADLRTQVYNNGDRGLMSIELAPTFPADPTLYVLYARDAPIGGSAPRWGSPNVNADPCPNPPGDTIDGCTNSGRLSALTLTGATAGSERVIIDDWCAQFPSHAPGDLAFGPDGYLYASAGDGASYTFADYGQAGSPRNPCGDPPGGVGGTMTVPTAEGGALRSQDVQTDADPQGLSGTVIRIDPATGEGAPGNPLATSTDANRRRIVGAGLRNPYRMTFRPGSGELWFGEVGSNRWEEINRITSPIDGTLRNFGWPCNEGNARNATYDIGLDRCNAIYSGAVATTAPYDTYSHAAPVVAGDGCATNGSSTSGIAFYPGGAYPEQYDGALFFADYSRRCIWVTFAGSNGLPDPGTRTLFRQVGAFAVDLRVGPNNDLFYVDIAAGAVRRIRYNSGAQPPVASIAANPAQGALPLTTTLSAAGSSDPQGSALTYAWDLDGDGEFDDATGPTATRIYTTAGAHQPAVRVTNTAGLSDAATTRVLAGTTPPTATISAPASSLRWNVGDAIEFAGGATDAEDGAVPASALSWQVVLNHCTTIDTCHDHVLTTVAGVASGTVPAPDHDYPASLELRLTATDSSGVATTVSRRLLPNVVEVVVETDPPGLQATFGASSGATPLHVPTIVGARVGLSTPASQTVGTATYGFTGWSDGGARVHDVIVPATAPTYRASFATAPPAPPTDPALVAAYNFDEGAGTRVVDRSGSGNDGTAAGTTWAGGHAGGALSFDGSAATVTVADAPELDLTTGLTIEAWVRPATTSSWRTVVMKERPGGLAYALYSSGDGSDPSGYGFIGGAERGVVGPSALPVGAWTHLATTYDGTTMRLYVNGTQLATRNQPGALGTSASPLRIGGNSVWGERFSGLIDDVRIYGRALTAGEIAADRDRPVTSSPTGSTPPTAPTGLTATGGPGRVHLAWTAATDDLGVTAYTVHRSAGTATFTPSAANQVGTTPGTSFDDTGLAEGTYTYRVVAHDGSGNASEPSAPASATVAGPPPPPVDGLVAAYSFDEGGGSTVADRTDRGHTGTITGATWTGGHTGGGLSFDGSTSTVTIADHPDLDLGALTVSAWVRPTTTSGWRTIALKERPGGLAYALYASGATPTPSGWSGAAATERAVTGPTPLPLGAWSHVAVTHDLTTLRLYVNGVLVASTPVPGPSVLSDGVLSLGGNGVWGEHFAGDLDDVRIYGRALTAPEVAADRDTPVANDVVAPTVPTGVVATAGAAQVSLTWTPSTDAVGVTGYDLHRSSADGFAVGPETLVAATAATTFTDAPLAPGTYHYRVVARDAAGNASAPSDQASAIVGDTTAPTVALTTPADGATVTGSMPVTASATDASGIAGVQFRLDGANLGAEDTTSPYGLTWNTGSALTGTHVLTAVARDAAGNTTTSAAVTVVVRNPPVAAYSFDEGAGETLVDRSGRGHHGTISGATWTAGRTGGALAFDGVDDLVTIADSNLLDLTRTFTIEAWVRPDTTTGWSTIAVKEAPTQPAYALYACGPSTGPVGSTAIGGARQDVVGPTVPAPGAWSHVAVTYDNLTLRLYVNGNQVATRSQNGSTATSTGSLVLGGSAMWGEWLDGALDDVRIYNRALKVAEIRSDRATPVT